MELEPESFAFDAERSFEAEAALPAIRETRVEVSLARDAIEPSVRKVLTVSGQAGALCAEMGASLVTFGRAAAKERGLSERIEAITCTIAGIHGPSPAFRIRRFRTVLSIDGTLSDHEKATVVLAAGAPIDIDFLKRGQS